MISRGYASREGGRGLRMKWQALYNRENGKNWRPTSSCALTYLPATTRHQTVVDRGHRVPSPFQNPFPISTLLICDSGTQPWPSRKDNRQIQELERGPEFLHTLAVWPREALPVSLTPAFLIGNKGRTPVSLTTQGVSTRNNVCENCTNANAFCRHSLASFCLHFCVCKIVDKDMCLHRLLWLSVKALCMSVLYETLTPH